MKIGILTLTLDTNYGGILQAYALQTVLERMGHEVFVFNRHPHKIKANWLIILKRFYHKLFGGKIVVFSEAKLNREAPIVNKKIWNFRDNNIKEVFIESFDDIKYLCLDCIVVGSDQIWRPKYFKEQWNDDVTNAFLSFTDGWNIKRVAYAASFGADTWEYSEQETNEIQQSIKLFDAIAVREHEGINLLKRYLNVSANFTVDPTLLLSVNDYKEIVYSSSPPKSLGNLLSYILDPTDDKEALLNLVSAHKNLKPFSVNRDELMLTKPIEERIKPGIDAWLRGFMDADFIVTDSFHACVFSLIFNKPFVVVGNKDRGMARFYSLLTIFKQEFRLVNSVQQYIERSDMIHCSPNVENLIDEERKKAIKYLSNSLTDGARNKCYMPYL